MSNKAQVLTVIKQAKSKKELAEAQALFCCEFRVHPFATPDSKAEKKWDDYFENFEEFRVDDSRVQYGNLVKGKFKSEGFFVPPPILFDSDVALKFAKLKLSNPSFKIEFDDNVNKWQVIKLGKQNHLTASHRYLAAAIIIAMLEATLKK